MRGVSVRTIRRRIDKGEQEFVLTKTNRYMIPIHDMDSSNDEYVVTYSRVSSSENKSNMKTQTKRLQDFCSANGWIVRESIEEVGSGLNDDRKKLLKLLTNKKVTKIVVEHKDRLTRFGFNYINTLYHGDIIIINEVVTDEEDLMQDFISLVTSFCARLYGRRRTRRRTEKIIKELESDKS